MTSTDNPSIRLRRLPSIRRSLFSERRRIWTLIAAGGLLSALVGGVNWWNNRPTISTVVVIPNRWPQSTFAMRTPGRLRVLFLGNSLTQYNGGQALIMEQLSQSAGKKPVPVFDQVVKFGATWAVLCDRTQAVEMIDQGRWDYVILQDYSTAALVYRTEMDVYGRKLSREVRAIGARPVFFMTWPHEDEPNTTQKIAGAYISVAAANHGVVAPVALAWQTVLRDRPWLVLYDQHEEKPAKHPTPAGSYLAACVFYSVLYHESPHGLTSRIVEGTNVYINLPAADALYLQDVAWKTVQDSGQLSSTRPAMRPSATGPTTVPALNDGGSP